jgi:hypothetical protein
MRLPTIASERILISFGDSPLEVARIQNRVTGETLCASGHQALLVRMPEAVSDPVFLTRVKWERCGISEVCLTACDERGLYQARLEVSEAAEGLLFRLRVACPEPVWLVEWNLSGLFLDDVIVPALGGQVITSAMPQDVMLTYKYPFWWNAQFVLGSTRAGGLLGRTLDRNPGFRLLRIGRVGKAFSLGLGFEAEGPLRSGSLEAVWYLDCYGGDWRCPVDWYRAWLEKAFQLVPLDDNPRWPDWAKHINFILEIWGMGKQRPEPHHTFVQMRERLKSWRRLHPPEQTLVYLPGFAEHGIDSRAPDYNPSKELGGKKGFRELVIAAKDMGYHLMVHTNALAMTFAHPLYAKFKRHQVVDVFGRRQGWGLDIDGDWLAEPYFAYINPGVQAWRDLMREIIGELIADYDLDAIFLDQTLLAFNVSRGPNFVLGMRDHIKGLANAFPRVLFAGEGLHEHVAAVLPMAQIHGLDSITEGQSLQGRRQWRKVHPVSVYLFGRYTRFVAHLLTKHPSHPLFRWQERAYAELGVLPALALYDSSQPMDTREVRQMLRRARSIQ